MTGVVVRVLDGDRGRYRIVAGQHSFEEVEIPAVLVMVRAARCSPPVKSPRQSRLSVAVGQVMVGRVVEPERPGHRPRVIAQREQILVEPPSGDDPLLPSAQVSCASLTRPGPTVNSWRDPLEGEVVGVPAGSRYLTGEATDLKVTLAGAFRPRRNFQPLPSGWL